MQRTAPIGMFDSGMGGLSVYREVRRELPHESLVYVADSAHVPYGDKPAEYIERRAGLLTEFLVQRHAVKTVVIACNTATAFAVRRIRERFAVPVVAMEPALRPAAAATRTGVVGVLATAGTLESSQFESLVDRFGKDVQVIARPGSGLVEQVERGDVNGSATRAIIHECLSPMLAAGADAIVLGSTHYVFLRPLIQEMVGPEVALFDAGAAVARRLRQVLDEGGLLGGPDTAAMEQLWTSGDPAVVSPVASKLLGRAVTFERLPEKHG